MRKMEDWRDYVLAFLVILLAVLVFTGGDYLVHASSPDFAVPPYYFKNKLIFGTLMAFVVFLFFKDKETWVKSLIISGITSVLLQLRYYFIEHYPLGFVLEFLVIHFAIFFPALYLALRVFSE